MARDTKDSDGVLRYPADSQAWRTIDEKFPKIVEYPRNLRLGISAVGVDINTGNRHHRVDTYDVSIKNNFNLHAVVLWTIIDYRALGTLCGCPYGGFKDFASDISTDSPATIEMVNATKDYFDKDDLVKFQEQLLDIEKPLYERCPDFTKLFVIVKLLNLKGKYGPYNKFFTELLGLIKKMLPAGNKMDDKDLTACQTCWISRWKVDNKTHKVYENIPAKDSDGVLRYPADSQAWRTIDEKFPKIAEDPRNLWLGISTVGVDINTGNRHHSVWPVLTVIYNLPSWLCMKRKFIMLSVLLSGYPGNDIDVF
nr:hypothetical protein [Tanacetum cinerariifolium]